MITRIETEFHDGMWRYEKGATAFAPLHRSGRFHACRAADVREQFAALLSSENFLRTPLDASDTGTEAIEQDPSCSWDNHSGGVLAPVSGMKMRSIVGLSAHSAFHW